jgi:hypothetical protein
MTLRATPEKLTNQVFIPLVRAARKATLTFSKGPRRGRAAAWARLAEEIASRVWPEPWRDRLQGYAAAHGANALRVAGDLKASEAGFDRARRLWHAGAPSRLKKGGVKVVKRGPFCQALSVSACGHASFP